VMLREDFHVHSTFSDGKNTPEEIVAQALSIGLERLGFSEHSYALPDIDSCIPYAQIPVYRQTIAALKEQYAGRIQLFCGIEQDIWSQEPAEGYDYVIGSVHYLKLGEEYYSIDWKPEFITEAAEKHFDGDLLAVAEEYFRLEGEVYERTGCDIIGHFDLVSKLNERYGFFDTQSIRYRHAWQTAADRLLKSGAYFEINTGAISRGYRSSPYPSTEILHYLSDRGARFILSGDSHSAQNLCYGFEQWERTLKAEGIHIDRLRLR